MVKALCLNDILSSAQEKCPEKPQAALSTGPANLEVNDTSNRGNLEAPK